MSAEQDCFIRTLQAQLQAATGSGCSLIYIGDLNQAIYQFQVGRSCVAGAGCGCPGGPVMHGGCRARLPPRDCYDLGGGMGVHGRVLLWF